MQVREALLIEGTTNLSILCYGLFSPSELDAAFEALHPKHAESTSRVHKLLDDEWPNGLLLREAIVSSEENFSRVVSEAIIDMFSVGRCMAAVCMYDGAFGKYGDIFAEDVASQTYAFAFSSAEPVVALDSQLLASDEWRLVIAHCRRRVG